MNSEGKDDPPIGLYCRENIKTLEYPDIVVIGARALTLNGVIAGKYFSVELTKRGFNIITGLAISCDTIVHRGALEVGGFTTAFFAAGLDWKSIYPEDNKQLVKDIVESKGYYCLNIM